MMSEDTVQSTAQRPMACADVEEAMKDVVDPELGINVVDLGLVYGIHVDDENVATLDMTLTSAACPLTDVIEDQARQALCAGRVAVSSATSGSTGSGCRRGAPTRSPTRAATNCAPSASTSDSPPRILEVHFGALTPKPGSKIAEKMGGGRGRLGNDHGWRDRHPPAP